MSPRHVQDPQGFQTVILSPAKAWLWEPSGMVSDGPDTQALCGHGERAAGSQNLHKGNGVSAVAQ